MQKNIFLLLFVLSICSFTSCTQVIDIDLPTSEPRLVVEGNFDFDENDPANVLYVKLSLTTDYFNTQIPVVNDAKVWVEDKYGNKFLMESVGEKGIYFTTEIPMPTEGDQFKLAIIYDGDLYEGTEIYSTSPVIEKIEQRRENYFDKPYYTVSIFYQDVPKENNLLNYYFLMIEDRQIRPQLRVVDNEFSRGSLMESLYISDEETKPGDTIRINMAQISRNYNDYMTVLLGSIDNGGGPFQVPSGKVIGNIKNITTPEKEALGYFRIIQKRSAEHIIYEQPKP